jgi:hypothetical protein
MVEFDRSVPKVVVLSGAVEPANSGTWELGRYPCCAASTQSRLSMVWAPRRRLSFDSEEAGMKRLLELCAALDVHRKQVTVCVRPLGGGGEVEELVAEFLDDGLRSCSHCATR